MQGKSIAKLIHSNGTEAKKLNMLRNQTMISAYSAWVFEAGKPTATKKSSLGRLGDRHGRLILTDAYTACINYVMKGKKNT